MNLRYTLRNYHYELHCQAIAFFVVHGDLKISSAGKALLQVFRKK